MRSFVTHKIHSYLEWNIKNKQNDFINELYSTDEEHYLLDFTLKEATQSR